MDIFVSNVAAATSAIRSSGCCLTSLPSCKPHRSNQHTQRYHTSHLPSVNHQRMTRVRGMHLSRARYDMHSFACMYVTCSCGKC